MSWFCKIFGHKFITNIYHGKWDSEYYSVSECNKAFCKRCGIGLNEINKCVRKKEKTE